MPIAALDVLDRVAGLLADLAVGLADIVAAGGEEALQFPALGARQRRIVRRPGGADAGQTLQPVAQERDGEAVGFGGVVGIDRIEIPGDQEGRPVDARPAR